MEKSLFEQLAEIANKYYQYPNLHKIDSKTIYQHKKNAEDRFTNPEEFFNRRLNGADYEKIVELSSPIKSFYKDFFGDEEFKVTHNVKKDMHIIKLMFAATNLISTNPINPEQIKDATTPDIKAEFRKAKKAAQTKIQNVRAGKNKSTSLQEAKDALLDVYTKFGVPYIPKNAKTNL